jgi:hypothetical protein
VYDGLGIVSCRVVSCRVVSCRVSVREREREREKQSGLFPPYICISCMRYTSTRSAGLLLRQGREPYRVERSYCMSDNDINL